MSKKALIFILPLFGLGVLLASVFAIILCVKQWGAAVPPPNTGKQAPTTGMHAGSVQGRPDPIIDYLQYANKIAPGPTYNPSGNNQLTGNSGVIVPVNEPLLAGVLVLGQEASDSLYALLFDRNPLVRQMAVAALSRIHKQEAVRVLVLMSIDPHPLVRMQVVIETNTLFRSSPFQSHTGYEYAFARQGHYQLLLELVHWLQATHPNLYSDSYYPLLPKPVRQENLFPE